MKRAPAWFPDKLTVGIRKRELGITTKFSAQTIRRMELPLTMMGKTTGGSGLGEEY